MRIIAIMNQKGGCGKTTTAINLASGLARIGLRVLLVDMDPQSHCAAGLGIPENRIDLDIGDALLTSPTRSLDTARLAWRAAKNLDLIPSRMKLAGLEAARGGLADKEDKEHRLAGVLGKVAKGYDIAVIDCSPSIGLLTYNALAAAEAVLVPVETGFFSMQGATKQLATIKTMSRRLASSRPAWIVPTMHDGTSTLSEELLTELRKRFGERVAPVVVRLDPALRESASVGRPVHDHAPHSPGANDYSALGAWLHAELGLGRPPAVSHPAPEVIVRPEADEFVESHIEAAEDEECIDEVDEAPDVPAPDDPPAPLPLPPPPAPVLVTRAAEVANRARQLSRKPPPETAPRAFGAAGGRSPLLGARATDRGVLFVQPASVGHDVCIAGDFNGWSASACRLRLNEQFGIFELLLRLPPGKHSYRLVIDGVWMADPYNLHCELNPFGDRNSIVEVAAPARIAV